jgi:hypothetical protein
LIIRNSQKEAFSAASNHAFEQSAIEHLRKELPEAVAGRSDDDLLVWVRDAVSRSSAFGLKTQRQIMCFLDAEALLGERFYRQKGNEWAMSVLRSANLSAQDKAGVLLATACSVHSGTKGAKR